MRTHLSHGHPSVSLQSPTSSSQPKQTTLTFVKENDMPQQKVEELTRKLALMCALDLKPISMVEGLGFRYFLHSLNPQYKVPCRKTVSKYLQKLYEEEKADLISTITGLDVSITSDLWTSTAQQGYIGITAHYISSDWILSSKVLGTRLVVERHTGTNIASEILKIKTEFQLSSCVALVTDNAANMLTASRELNLAHVNCFAHTLQLAIEDGLKLPQILRVLGAARKLGTHFSHSLLATNALLCKQGDSKLKLVQDVPTRWNSSYDMMARLLKLRVAVYGVIFDESVTSPNDRVKLDIRDDFWKVMEDIVPVLDPLADITEVLGKEDQPTGSGVHVILYSIFKDVLNFVDHDSNVVRNMKLKIKEGLQKRFKVSDQGQPMDAVLGSPLLIASLLDPRYKTLVGRDIVPEGKIEILYLVVTDSMGELNNPTATQEDSNSGAAVPPKKSKLWEILGGEVSSNYNQQSQRDELLDYIREPVTISDPLMWWKRNEFKFPRLGQLAKKYLAVPATAVPSERTFFTAGLTVTKLRANLDAGSVDQIVFLNKNSKSTLYSHVKSVVGEVKGEVKVEPQAESEISSTVSVTEQIQGHTVKSEIE